MTTDTFATPVAPSVLRVSDTCNVYVLTRGGDATLIDVGSGAIFDRLDELGVERVTDVVVTHHHRDGVQGLARAAAAGARIWVPPVELRLIAGASAFWQERQTWNDYDLRQDKLSLLESVPVTGAVAEYRTRAYGGFELYALPTPGHTAGSVTYLLEADGQRVAFCGDLVHAGGKVPSLAATQWSYSGGEGLAATHVSCNVLAAREPDLLLPAHGSAIEAPAEELATVRARVAELFDLRLDQPWDLDGMFASPWVPVTEHLLRNRASFANSYVLVSESGAALVLDFGYDVTTGLVPRTEYEARRALLWPFDSLRREHGVERIEAAIPTHFHDDHVAGLNLLRDVEGTEVWAPENVAPILLDPARHDLPCLWYEPIWVDRVLTLGESLRWHEYELRLHPLPGHTLYAAAIEVEVDGKRILVTGDQQSAGERPTLNYQYRNRFRPDDFVASAVLYRRLRPDVIVSGHWLPLDVTDELLDTLERDGARLAELHREVLPEEAGLEVRIEPYRCAASAGDSLILDVLVRNPYPREATARIALAASEPWALPEPQDVALSAGGESVVRFEVVAAAAVRRARVAADVTIDGVPFGQAAEGLVDVA